MMDDVFSRRVKDKDCWPEARNPPPKLNDEARSTEVRMTTNFSILELTEVGYAATSDPSA